MKPIKIIQKYYKEDSLIYKLLVKHSELVSKKAIQIAKNVPQMNPDLEFITEGAMLHDIGMFKIFAPKIGCFGESQYILHGILGGQLLRNLQLPKHARVCETHTAISLYDIEKQNLPLPKKDFLPTTIEEEIISLADKFYSKSAKKLEKEKSIEEVRESLKKFGNKKIKYFDNLCKKYNLC